jgi:hypothetical protein
MSKAKGRKPANHAKKHALTPEMEARKWKPGQSGNPKGRPKTHDELRELIQAISSEPVLDKSKYKRLETMLRSMFASKSAVDHIAVLEHGWGKVPQQVDLHAEITQRSDSDLIAEFQSLMDAARARAGADDSGGAEAADSDGHSLT